MSISTPQMALLDQGVEVVVVKCGAEGCYIVSNSGKTHVPSCRQRARVVGWHRGHFFGDVCCTLGGPTVTAPVDAAYLASAAVSVYADRRALPMASVARASGEIRFLSPEARGRAYIAGPFFTIEPEVAC